MSRWWSEGEPKEDINTTYVILYGDQYSNRLIFGYYDRGSWYDPQKQMLKKASVLLWHRIPDWEKSLEEKYNKKTGE